jgi:hypothetical protein
MKLVLWVMTGFVACVLGAWLMSGMNSNPFAQVIGAIPWVVAPVGALWMIIVASKREKHPWPKIWLALLVPFSSLWYYFEEVRHDKDPVRWREGVGWPKR